MIALALALAATTCTAEIRSGMDAAAYAAAQAEQRAAGKRLEADAVADVDGTPVFTALWSNAGPATRVLRSGLGQDAFYYESAMQTAQEYRMVDLTVGLVAGSAYYTGIFEAGRDVQQAVYYWISEREAAEKVAAADQQVQAIAPFIVAGHLYFAVLVNVGKGLKSHAAVGLDSTKFAQLDGQMTTQGLILARKIAYAKGGKTRFAAVWRDPAAIGDCAARLSRIDLSSHDRMTPDARAQRIAETPHP